MILTWQDAAGLVGVLLVLLAYAGAAMGRIQADGPLPLAANLIGACLILASLLTAGFNLSATAMEGSWAVVSLVGLVRWGWRKLRG